jgi:hypothetical protein
MSSIAPLNPQQLADLYGALDDFVGTGDNINAIFNTTFFPVVVEKNLTDDLIGLGDGVATAYNTNFFCDPPRTIQNLKLYRTSVADPLNELTIVTHYTVNTTTGAITLTPAGVTFLGMEEFHATYVIPSTVELHTGTIAGPLLVEVTDYAIVARTGEITLTPAGITALGLSQLHVAYYTEKGSINFIDEDSAGLGSGRVQLRIRKREVNAKDQDLRVIHEAVETKAIVHLELEKKNLAAPGTFVTGAEQITEAVLVANVQNSYRAGGSPLFPQQTGVGFVSNPQIPNTSAPGLNGGSGVFAGNEEGQNAIELTENAIVAAIGIGDLPAVLALRFLASGPMTAAITAENVALAAQIAAITALLTEPDNNNPLGNDHITAVELADATAASAAASARSAANTAYLATVPFPHTGLTLAALAARATATTARQTFITGTREPQILVTLTDPGRLYDRREFWIIERARLGDGTLAVVDASTKGDAQIGTLLSQNATRRQNILDIILAQ